MTAETLYRQAFWLGPLVFAAAAGLLGVSILRLARLGRESRLASLPLAAEQAVGFDDPGTVVLSVEGPRGTTRFAGLRFRLFSQEPRQEVPGKAVLFRLKHSGLALASLEVESFDLPRAGEHILRVEGLGPGDSGLPDHRLVFSSPHRLKSVLLVGGILLSAGLALAGVVFTILRAAARTPGAP